MVELTDICGILVSLHAGGKQILFIMLADDGTMNRMGTGSLSNTEKDLFIGKSSPEVFVHLREMVGPELLQWTGRQLTDPKLRGKTCELVLGFKKRDGSELMSKWQYGSESLGPPPEIADFVIAAVEKTNPWYEEQKRKTGVT